MAIDQWLGLLVMPGLFLLLYIVGMILALVYWRRCPAACSLLFTASILSLVGSGGRVGLPLLMQMGAGPFFRELMWGLTFLNWLGVALMLMAIFAGRNEPTPAPPRRWPDEDDSDLPSLEAPPPPSSTKGGTGIQVR